ncbi:MAG TPA: hypothetical protein VFZ25_21875 [Chloroflexota bacterium]|nr:hypothetical protein [Chloroflexota bacterium]
MDKNGKRVKTTEEEWMAPLGSVDGSGDAETGKSRDVARRLNEMERELAGSARSVSSVRPARAELVDREPETEQPTSLAALFFGLGMTAAGAYLVMEHVTVFSGNLFWGGFWGGMGQPTLGLTLLPVLIGIGLLVYGKSKLGWTLTALGALIIFLNILTSLRMAFRPTGLFEVILMFGLLAAGAGLTLRGMRKASR